MTRPVRWLAALLVLSAACLSGCGKKGSPVPPGPPDQIVYPKSYPTR